MSDQTIQGSSVLRVVHRTAAPADSIPSSSTPTPDSPSAVEASHHPVQASIQIVPPVQPAPYSDIAPYELPENTDAYPGEAIVDAEDQMYSNEQKLDLLEKIELLTDSGGPSAKAVQQIIEKAGVYKATVARWRRHVVEGTISPTAAHPKCLKLRRQALMLHARNHPNNQSKYNQKTNSGEPTPTATSRSRVKKEKKSAPVSAGTQEVDTPTPLVQKVEAPAWDPEDREVVVKSLTDIMYASSSRSRKKTRAAVTEWIKMIDNVLGP